MALLYADEDFPRPAVACLRALGHDVATVSERGRSGRIDEQVLEDATVEGRVVLTHNRKDFERLHRTSQEHPGIISCTRDDEDHTALANRIHIAIEDAGDLTGRHIRVNRPS